MQTYQFRVIDEDRPCGSLSALSGRVWRCAAFYAHCGSFAAKYVAFCTGLNRYYRTFAHGMPSLHEDSDDTHLLLKLID